MPLELHPLEEADLDAYIEITSEAFKEKDQLLPLMYPHGYSAAARAHAKATALKQWRKHPDIIRKMKVMDTSLPATDPYNRIVGFSNWHIHAHARGDAEIQAEEAESHEDGFAPGADEKFMETVFGAMGKCKKEILGGKPFVYLQLLATHPRHHRRGIGALNLRWGLERADELGLPVYLESSPMGRELYARLGFETVGWLPFDGREWGAEVEMAHALMLRPAKIEGAV